MGRKSIICRGLRPEPLSSYLGALGVLRTSALQLDPAIQGRFTPEGFEILGADEADLVEFFLSRWRPSPVLSPWNELSGFYAAPKGMQAVAALKALRETRAPRFMPLLEVADRIQSIIRTFDLDGAPKDDDKAAFLASLRRELPDDAIAWLDAVAVVSPDDVVMSPLLGSGGNEGVLEYSGLFLRSLTDVFLGDTTRARALLKAALFAAPARALVDDPGGQFDPGVAGGFNTGPGFEHKQLPKNPWSFLLLIEGALCWTGTLARRGQASGPRVAVSPFTVRHVGAGHSSAADSDGKSSRGEVWTPIWRRPLGLPELLAFLGEGRAELRGADGRSRPAATTTDFVEAVASLGVARGVDRFVRYALVKRRGDAFVALPADTVDVAERRVADLLRELDAPLRRIDSFARSFAGDGPPARFTSLRRTVEERRLALAAGLGSTPLEMLRAVGALAQWLAARDPMGKPPPPPPARDLHPAWLAACGDVPEFRVAAALAAVRGDGAVGPLRSDLEPIDPAHPAQIAKGRRNLAWAGADVFDRLAAVLDRRVNDARKAGAGKNPLASSRSAPLDDVLRLLDGRIDGRLLEELLFASFWIRADDAEELASRPAASPPPPDFALLKLVHLPSLRIGGERVPILADPGIVPLLRAGRVADAVDIAGRRLRAMGLAVRQPADRNAAPDPAYGRRLAAALLVPVADTRALLRSALLPDAAFEHAAR